MALGINGGEYSISSAISERPEVSEVVASALGAIFHFCFLTLPPSQIWQPEIGAYRLFFVPFPLVFSCVSEATSFFFANFVAALEPNWRSLNSQGTPWPCTSCEPQLKIVITLSPSNTWSQNIWLIVSVRCDRLPFIRVNCYYARSASSSHHQLSPNS